MSTDANTRLMETAAELIDYFEGKQPAQRIERALELNDLELLFEEVKTAHGLMLASEYQPDYQPISDEDIAQMSSDELRTKAVIDFTIGEEVF